MYANAYLHLRIDGLVAMASAILDHTLARISAAIERSDTPPFRKTTLPPRVSVYDVIGAVTGYRSETRNVLFQRIRRHLPELACTFVKFPGRGQRATPVVDNTTLLRIIAAIPGTAASTFRQHFMDSGMGIDAEGILREHGCDPAQIGQLAGELGRDLILVSESENREKNPLAEAMFGPDLRMVRQYHRVVDARLIQDVLRSFYKRQLWQRVASDDNVTVRRMQLLDVHGRGRKRQRV